MITQNDIQRLFGTDVYEQDGDKIGSTAQVYLDNRTGDPEWVSVKTGLFGTKETFVPLAQAELSGEQLRFPYDKAKVKDAPKVDTDGHLSPQEEQELYRYYGMQVGQGTQTDTTVGRVDRDQQAVMDPTTTTETTGRAGMAAGSAGMAAGTTGRTDRDRDGRADHTGEAGVVGRDVSGPTTDNAMTRSEERLNVGTRSEEVGRARLRKYVVTENVTETVPVSREEVRVEREPITDANVGNAMDGPAISEEEHEVTLHAERPVVEKEAVPVERVRLDKETVTEQERVTADVRKEEIEVDGARGTGVTGGDDRSFTQKAKDTLDRDNDGRIGR